MQLFRKANAAAKGALESDQGGSGVLQSPVSHVCHVKQPSMLASVLLMRKMGMPSNVHDIMNLLFGGSSQTHLSTQEPCSAVPCRLDES